MDFNELIADFATRHNVDGLAAEDGAAALDVDGILVNLVAAGDLLAASAEIGEPPAEGAGTFAELLLEASLDSEAFFAKSREGKRRNPRLRRRRLHAGVVSRRRRGKTGKAAMLPRDALPGREGRPRTTCNLFPVSVYTGRRNGENSRSEP